MVRATIGSLRELSGQHVTKRLIDRNPPVIPRGTVGHNPDPPSYPGMPKVRRGFDYRRATSDLDRVYGHLHVELSHARLKDLSDSEKADLLDAIAVWVDEVML